MSLSRFFKRFLIGRPIPLGQLLVVWFVCCYALSPLVAQPTLERHNLVGRWQSAPVPTSWFSVVVESNSFVRFEVEVQDSDIEPASESSVEPVLFDPREKTFKGGDGILIVLTPTPMAGDNYCLEITTNGTFRSYCRLSSNRVQPWECGNVVSRSDRTDHGYRIVCDIPILTLTECGLFDPPQSSNLFGTLFQFDSHDGVTNAYSWRSAQTLEPDPFAPSALGLILSPNRVTNDDTTEKEALRIVGLRYAERELLLAWNQFLREKHVVKGAQNWMENLDQFPEAERWEIMTQQDGPPKELALPQKNDVDADLTQTEVKSFVGQEWSLRLRCQDGKLAERLPMRLVNKQSGDAIELVTQNERLIVKVRSKGRQTLGSVIRIEDSAPIRDVVIVYRGSSFDHRLSVYLDGSIVDALGIHSDFTDWGADRSTGGGPEGDTGTAMERRQWESNLWRIDSQSALDMVTLYNRALTRIEVASMEPTAKLRTWDELKPWEKQAWTEHFARRVDRDGKYLQESFQHYAFAATQQKASQK
jgi:hypothetical protein